MNVNKEKRKVETESSDDDYGDEGVEQFNKISSGKDKVKGAV